MFMNPLFWLFALPGLLLGLYAQAKIKSNFSRYSQIPTPGNLTGAEVAQRLLAAQGVHDVAIEPASGMLTDHYDPRSRVLRLSEAVYGTPSIAAAGVAAHEAGHALQDATGYLPMRLRGLIVPAVQFGTTLAPWLFLAGYLLGILELAWAGVLLFALSTVFSLVTLPVEIDASNRAKQLLASQHILGPEELGGVKKVLSAAAWTYVAAAVSSVGNLLYYVLLLSGSDRRRRSL